jgi:hypothetical protein
MEGRPYTCCAVLDSPLEDKLQRECICPDDPESPVANRVPVIRPKLVLPTAAIHALSL